MSEIIGEDNIRENLTAFADGELTAEQIVSVLDYLAEHPEALQLMRTQQRLRVAAERAVRAATPPVSDELRRRLEALVPQANPESARPRFRGMGWWTPVVAAGLLLAGGLAGRTLLPPHGAPRLHGPPVVARPEAIVPAATVAHAMRVHADCSRLPKGLHAAAYPRELARLADVVRQDLGGTNPYPDLSGIGYAFAGAGPCAAPLADTVHLLYESIGPGHKRTVSIFVQQQRNQFELEAAKLYVVSDALSPFPMYAWRTDDAVYFLLADDEPAIREARQTIAAAPAFE